MKLTKLIKSVIVLTSIFFLSAQSWARSSDLIPYYGDSFYQDYDSGVKDESLALRLKQVLRSYHVLRAGATDLVVEKCENVGRCYGHSAITYKAARKVIMSELYTSKAADDTWQVFDVYCGRQRGQVEFGGKLGGGIIPDNKILNVEHTWPQSRFNKQLPKDTQKSDLHHLFPADSLLNAIRGSHPFGEVTHEEKMLKCGESHYGLGTSGTEDIFEPPQAHKGNVARALFYFSIRYDLPIEDQEEAVLRQWNQEDPVDDQERARNDRIFEIQKNRNPFVDFPELVDRISSF